MSAELDLWQTEWCPSSHRVRQRLTELGLTYTVHQVPTERVDRDELMARTGQQTIPALIADGVSVEGEAAIVRYLNEHFAEPAGAAQQRAKAATIRKEQLEQACSEVAGPAVEVRDRGRVAA